MQGCRILHAYPSAAVACDMSRLLRRQPLPCRGPVVAVPQSALMDLSVGNADASGLAGASLTQEHIFAGILQDLAMTNLHRRRNTLSSLQPTYKFDLLLPLADRHSLGKLLCCADAQL